VDVAFETVDVFTDRQFGGNPLAVIAAADGLSDARMQAIAAEFNLSETTFVLPPADAANTARVRIFTPRAEMPFAGHPNVGTAYVLARQAARRGRPFATDTLRFEEISGLVEIELLRQGGAVSGARLASPQPLEIGDTVAAEIVAAACGIAAADIGTARHQPVIASCGAPFVLAEVTAPAALAAAEPRSEAFAAHLPRERVTGIQLYVHADGGGADIRTRVFAPLHGVPEDAATGSSNVALIGLLASLEPAPDARVAKTIAQGAEMGRPSLLEARAAKTGGGAIATWIGGACVPVMRGTIELA